MYRKEFLSTSNSKQIKPQTCPETSVANSRLVRAKGGFEEKLCAWEGRRVDQKFYVADFVSVIQKPSRGHYNSCIFLAQSLVVTLQLLNQITKSSRQNFRFTLLLLL